MGTRLNYNNNDQIGKYFKLTNSFCIIPEQISTKMYTYLKFELEKNFPLISSNVGDSNFLGAQIISNSKGIICPSQTSMEELINLKKQAPDNVVVRKCPDSIYALGNCISTNDYFSIMNSNLDNRLQEFVSDTLGTELFTIELLNDGLTGSLVVFNNLCGIISPLIKIQDHDELSSMLQIPLISTTVNRGSPLVGSGILLNDNKLFYGIKTTKAEAAMIETLFEKVKI